jgi:hypothetical protein
MSKVSVAPEQKSPARAKSVWGRVSTAGSNCNIDVAIRQRLNNTPSRRIGTQLVEWGFTDFSLNKFVDFGIGTYFYYKLLLMSFLYLVFCTVFSVPVLFLYPQSDANELEVSTGLEPFCLGYLGMENNMSRISGYTKKDLGLFAALSDLAIVVGTLFFIHWVESDRQEQLAKYNKKIRINLYSIEVTNLPSNLTNSYADRMELKKFFDQLFGTVADVVFALDDLPLIKQYAKRGGLLTKMRNLKKNGKSTKKEEAQLAKLER